MKKLRLCVVENCFDSWHAEIIYGDEDWIALGGPYRTKTSAMRAVECFRSAVAKAKVEVVE